MQVLKVGTALHAASATIPKDFLNELILGILLAETSGLTPSEFASVLATSGTTSAEGSSIGNSWKLADLVESFCTQWGDEAIAGRDSRTRRPDLAAATVDRFNMSGLAQSMPRLEAALAAGSKKTSKYQSPQISSHVV